MIIFVSKLNKDGSRMKLRRRLITLDDFMVTSDILEHTKRERKPKRTKSLVT